MNVVDNLNSVQVINKPCVCSRTMRLSTFCGLRRDQEQHLSGQIAALITRDGSGEPFHDLQCERGAGKSKSWSKKVLEDVGRGQGCFKTLADYTQVQGKARKKFLTKTVQKIAT